MKLTKPLFKTSEKKYIYNFLYPYNSLSSISYIISGIILYDYNLLYSINLMLLGISSTLWWAINNDYSHFYDKLLYSLNLFLIGYLNDCDISIRFLFYKIFLYYYFNDSNRIIITSNIISSIYSFYILYSIEKYYEIFIFLISLLFKLNDTFNLIKINNIISGTALFHIISAYGMYILFI
jgi:hypothetical protein